MTEEVQRNESDAFEYTPSQEQKEKLGLLQSVINALREKNVRFAVAGGYGLDALHGSLTRNHKDYDFVVFDESKNGFQETVSTLGFSHHSTKESGTVVFGHDELEVKLEYMPVSKIQKFLQSAGVTDVDLESGEMLTSGQLGGVAIPTFNVETFRMFDSLSNNRFKNLDPHAAHKQRIYEAIKGKT